MRLICRQYRRVTGANLPFVYITLHVKGTCHTQGDLYSQQNTRLKDSNSAADETADRHGKLETIQQTVDRKHQTTSRQTVNRISPDSNFKHRRRPAAPRQTADSPLKLGRQPGFTLARRRRGKPGRASPMAVVDEASRKRKKETEENSTWKKILHSLVESETRSRL